MYFNLIEREEEERIAAEQREKEQEEYEERLRKLEEQAERQRQREREIEEREQKRREEAAAKRGDDRRDDRGRDDGGSWRRGGATENRDMYSIITIYTFITFRLYGNFGIWNIPIICDSISRFVSNTSAVPMLTRRTSKYM